MKTNLIRVYLNRIYTQYHRLEFIGLDPVQWLHRYPADEDKEIVGLISALMAFGNAKAFNTKIKSILSLFDSPYRDLTRWSFSELHDALSGFKHRFVNGLTVAKLLLGIRRVIEDWTRLGGLFRASMQVGNDERFWNSLQAVVEQIQRYAEDDLYFLLPQPSKGGVCKRLCLYLRWMVRKDTIDAGIWDFIEPKHLLVPVDTHVFQWGKRFGVISGTSMNYRTVFALTQFFRRIEPTDPLKYDFSLCIAGMLGEHSNLRLDKSQMKG